jgi:hypothetical protein
MMKVKKMHTLEELTWFTHILEGYEGHWYKKETVDEAIEELHTRTCENCGKYLGAIYLCEEGIEQPVDGKPFGCIRFSRKKFEHPQLKAQL